MTRSSRLLAAATVFLVAMSGVAAASWSVGANSRGNGAAAATTLDRGATPSSVAARGDVTVSWAASTTASGDPVGGYRIARYDTATLTAQPVGAGCAGVVADTSCMEAALPDGSWAYTVTPVLGAHWSGAESPLGDAVTTDSTLPANAITTTVGAGNAVQEGATIYYRGVAAGSFALTNAVADSSSGPASSTTTALAGDDTGWAHTPSTESSPAGGPYVSNPFSWAAGTTGSPTEDVTGRDAAGNSATSTLAFVDDSDPPTAGAISYPDGYLADESVPISFAAGTDAASGIAGAQLQRAEAALADGVCGVFAGFADLGAADPTSPYVDETVADGSCYRYRYLVSDRAGNVRVTTSASVTKVDPSAGGPPLGNARSYSVLAATGVTNTGPTTISGDLGVDPSPGSTIIGFPPGTVAGDVDADDAAAAAAQSDLSDAYDDAAQRSADAQFAGDQGGQTFAPGVYHTGAAFALTGTLTLDGQGDPNSLFVFQVGAALNTAAASHVVLVNGAQASHVFWQVLGAAGTGASSSFAGTIMAAGAITLGAGAQLIGRALSQDHVTLAGNTISFSDAASPTISIDGAAALETKDTTPTISGATNAAIGRTVTVTVAGQTLTSPVHSDGTWDVASAALTAGDHLVTATVRDAAGNAGSARQTLTIEVNPGAVSLGAAGTYSVLAGTAVVGTGFTALSGDLGVSPGAAVTGFPPGTVGGATHAGDSQADQAQSALVLAYADAAQRTPSSEFAGDQNGQTYHEGVHHTAAAFALTGTLTLDGQGDPDAVFIIQVGAALNTAASSHVVLTNGARASNVFWQVAGATNTGASSTFAGTIMSAGAVTLGDGAALTGRALTHDAVTLANNTVDS
ncbi:ice-binding family protein [uncultured Jatrophihabitans sp.]|uniref:ice-binding family protein n=1 Tax=uncultured Jatrophihabitans sp. TaxID=1610747 RepID=UPI0035CBC881